MATSAKTLSQIIDTLCDEYELDKKQVLKQLSTKDLLPAKLAKTPEKKDISIFASKQAEEIATQANLVLDEGKGSGKDGKYTVGDVKKALEAPLVQKLLISPSALNFANENNISVANITGTGKDSRILLSDVKKYISEKTESEKNESESESESE